MRWRRKEYTMDSSDFNLIISTAQEIALEKIAPRASEIDAKGEFPRDVCDLFRQYELFSLPFPEAYGGLEVPTWVFCAVVLEIARVCASSSMILGNQSLGSSPILLFGSPEQKERYLPALAKGDKLPAFALTEPDAGSDIKNIKTIARKTEGGYIISGNKIFITGGSVADLYCVFAKVRHNSTDGDLGVFVVERNLPGVRVGRDEDKMGLRGSPTSQLFFEDVFVPEKNLIGGEGQGFSIALACLNKGRLVSAAQAIGIAQGSLDVALKYSKQRVQFGRPICEFQAIQLMLADMITKTEAAYSLLKEAAEKYDHHTRDSALFASMSKLFATDMVLEVTASAVQILGGYGYTKDYPVERMMRDSKIFAIFEGTNQIQRLFIARQLLKD